MNAALPNDPRRAIPHEQSTVFPLNIPPLTQP
jgi:hypothetical protein